VEFGAHFVDTFGRERNENGKENEILKGKAYGNRNGNQNRNANRFSNLLLHLLGQDMGLQRF
jgi:hypothetical protein